MDDSELLPLSVVVIAQDETLNILACLDSASFAAEKVVLDGGSTDDTVELAQKCGARVTTQPFRGWIAQKNAALALASQDWVLSLDADERVSPALRDEIRELFTLPDGTISAEAPGCAGYCMPRLSFHLGRWIRGGGWYPDRKLRLFRRSSAHWGGRDPHDKIQLKGSMGTLRGDLLHYPYRNLAHHLEKMERYTQTAAERLLEDGRRGAWWRRWLMPPLALVRAYFLRAGFRDGRVGLRLALLEVRYEWLRYSKLYALNRAQRR